MNPWGSDGAAVRAGPVEAQRERIPGLVNHVASYRDALPTTEGLPDLVGGGTIQEAQLEVQFQTTVGNFSG